jgi:2-methylcitrate dehydratase
MTAMLSALPLAGLSTRALGAPPDANSKGATSRDAPAALPDATLTQLADFVTGLTYEKLSPVTVSQLKNRLLDTLACGIGAVSEPEVGIVFDAITTSSHAPCTLIGHSVKATARDAAMLNTSMTRYLDLMDSYVGPKGGGHPSDALGPTLACAELSATSSRNLIAAMAVAYEVLGAFADAVETRKRGWDHLVYEGLAMTAAAGKALQLSSGQLQNALSIVAASSNPLRVTRSEQPTMWKGFAAANTALLAVNAVILAKHGMVGPTRAFEGRSGWKEVVVGSDFQLSFTPGERVQKVWTKLYLAETYALSGVEAAIELARAHPIDPNKVKTVEVRTFHDAILNIGASEGRDPYRVTSKPEADHSFPYMIAAALIDKQLTRRQYTQERILGADVQQLLRKVEIIEDDGLTKRFAGGQSPTELIVTLMDGRQHRIAKDYFSGHPQKPADRGQIGEKFRGLAGTSLAANRIETLMRTLDTLEERPLDELMRLLRT